MNQVTSITLRRMRAPFLVLIGVYAISILVMTFIPGVDEDGNVWYMSIFHAFYFVSYTATTIGFGEIPYPLSDAQRLWALVIVYTSVISWFYALGKIITLVQDKTFQQVVAIARFKRNVKSISHPFYLICGLGETGRAVVNSLTEEHYRTVAVDQDPENINSLEIDELLEYVPSIVGDASDPEVLENAGIKNDFCRGVIAVTADDETNLKIAITSKLLHPDVPVICRSELKEFEENMLSFDTDYIVNPFETFSDIFAMAIHSPSLHLIYDWLTGAPSTSVTKPICFGNKHWILIGFGRFGKHLYKQLRKQNLRTTVIDPCPQAHQDFLALNDRGEDDRFIPGTGTDSATLTRAGAETASGIIAGSDNDSNNLSAIMTARALNRFIFIVARQNQQNSEPLYSAINLNYAKYAEQSDESPYPDAIAHLVMRPKEIIGRKIRALLITPLLLDFLDEAKNMDKDWANITISRLSAVIGSHTPHNWAIMINFDKAPAVAETLGFGRHITLGHITQDPSDHLRKLCCVPLLINRNNQYILLPDEETELQPFDRILFCGTRQAKQTLSMTITNLSNLNYVMTFKQDPESYIWRKMTSFFKKNERRTHSR